MIIRRQTIVFVALLVLGSVLAGLAVERTPANAQDSVPAPSSCTAAIDTSQITVEWPNVPSAIQYVIFRSVDSSPQWWRGASSSTSFVDSARSGQIVYFVSARAPSGELSERTPCTTTGQPGPAEPVTSCTATINGADIDVAWPPAANATQYVIRRSVNGGPQYWRGVSTTTTFTDSNRTGTLAYFVTSKGADGTQTTPTPCTTTGQPEPPEPVASCLATINGADIDVAWPPAANATQYVIRRSVNGGPQYWRGVSTTTTFTDSHRTGTLAYFVTSKGADGTQTTPIPCAAGQQPGFDADFLAVGDMADCGLPNDTAVGYLLDRLPQPVFALGDLVYPDGSAADFANCFDPPFGRHKLRFSPVPGNHEYHTPNASGYFDYFGAAAGDPGSGWYSQTHGDWQIIFFNSNCFEVGGCGTGSPQYAWLEAELAGAPAGSCRAVVMHHPRWSSWAPYESQAFLDPTMTLLDSYSVDLVLSGHAHHYERLAQVDATRAPNENGWRQFTVGTGGVALRTPEAADRLDVSEALITDAHGVLALSLDSGSYSWEFITTDNIVADSGSDNCNS